MNYRSAGSINYNLSEGDRIAGYVSNEVHLSQDFKDIQPAVSTGSFSSLIEAIPATFPFIILIWLLGVFIITVRMTGGFIITQRLRNSCLYSVPEEIAERFRKLVDSMNIDKVIKICESTLIHVPVVIGYFKPIILLPFSAISHIPCDQIEAIVAHELAHIRRRDYLVNVFQSVTETLFFYNPVIWIINRRIRKERENCCDDLAVMYSGGILTYAKALASINDIPSKYGFPLLAAASNKYYLLSRITRILKQGKMKTTIKDKLIAGFILLSAISIILLNTGGSIINSNSTSVYPVQNDYLRQTPGRLLTANPISQDPENLVNSEQSLRLYENSVSNNLVVPIPDNEPGFSSMPESIPVNDSGLNVPAPLHPDTTLKVKDNIVRRTFIKDGREMNIEMRVENGEVKELIVNGEKIPEDNYVQYQAEIDKTMEDLAELREELAEARVELAEVDMEVLHKEIEESMEEVRESLSEIDIEAIIPDIEEIEIPEIDEEKIRIEIENALAEIEAMDMEKINRGIEMAMESAYEANISVEIPDMEEIEIPEIDEEKIRIEIENALAEIEAMDMEKINRGIEMVMESAYEAIINVEIPDMKEIQAEIKKELEMVRKELELIDYEEIRAGIEKSISEIKVDQEAIRKEMEEALKGLEEIDIDEIKSDLDRERNRLDEILRELEKLELKK